jgi:hypothetical protein
MHNTQFHSRVKQLQQIGAAFDKGFDNTRSNGLQMEDLRERAHEKLAMEAIKAARYAFDSGQSLDYTYQDAVNYAVRIYPRIRMRRCYWGFMRRLVPGLRGLSRRPGKR